MSNRRRPGFRNSYRAEFLRSPEWFARRDRWFRAQDGYGIPLACAGCGQAASRFELELHHLDYVRVRRVDGAWRAFERHDDLLPLHPYCHDLLHRLIERDEVLAYHRTRRVASEIALERLQVRLRVKGMPR